MYAGTAHFDAGRRESSEMIVPYPLQYLCGGKHAGRGTLFVMVLLQLWYLIHIFDRNGGDAIVFHGYRQRT